jgi:hypothetical protein
VWHASVASQKLALSAPARREIALDVLDGVGDAHLGEWYTAGEKAIHVRRRLSAKEQRQVGPVLDVRCDLEGQRRAAAVQQYLPPSMRGEIL